METVALLRLLDDNAILYERIDHPPVFTCEEASHYLKDTGGVRCKNLLLKDRHGSAFFLLVTAEEKRVDLKQLASQLQARRLAFASAQELQQLMGLTPGAVSLLALVNDLMHKVRVIVDHSIWGKGPLHCHPLVNTATLLVKPSDLERFFKLTGHRMESMEIPGK